MFNSSNILIKYILLFCNIITLCFVLHTKQLLANTNEKDKNTELILKIISLVENNKLQQINKLLAKNSDKNLDDLVNWLMISNKNIEINDIENTIKKYEIRAHGLNTLYLGNDEICISLPFGASSAPACRLLPHTAKST